MEITEKKNLLFICAALLACWLMLMPAVVGAAAEKDEQAPGRSMAQQATKAKKLWRTSDHSKHKVLQQDFTSGAEVTQACISCHSEAETQFHKTIHWTWLADPAEKERQYGKAGNSLNNFCISTNKNDDKGCLSCHPGWGKTKETAVN
ncbi:MAG: cytochrome C, partial [Desulfobacterales bacterium]